MGIHSSIPLLNDKSEVQRLAVLDSLHLLDSAPEREFDTIVQCACDALHCKIALVSIVDDHRQWFKAKCGLDASETPREHAFCDHVVRQDAIMVVPDAMLDPRFRNNPLVTGPPHIRFYAGVPVRISGGRDRPGHFVMGTLCVIDDRPRNLLPDQETRLRDLAQLVESLLQARADAAEAIRLAEDRRSTLHRLDVSHRQFRQAERLANIGSWRLVLADNSVEWSDHVFVIHGLPLGSTPPVDTALDHYPPAARALVVDALTRTVEQGETMDIETDFLTAQGDMRRVRTMGELEMHDGLAVAINGVFRDVTDGHLLEQALRRAAHVDVLTGIANRAHFNECTDNAIATARADGTPLALLLIDLDHFKAVNDRCGHLAGDDLLRRMASRLRSTYLSDCMAARLGGDEFVLLATGLADEAALTALVSRLLADLIDVVDAPDGLIRVSATIGVAQLDDDVRDRSDLLLRADIALYEAKRTQRGSAKIHGLLNVITIS
ncbi:diguanylate cyclase domain-containing protein [Sphingobium sp.]|uniref:diguanylate cyclase domain-containing protein n=1 Tax=Sphingobium sp. TaxID=1912891 RepID=UPI003BB5E45D